MFKPFFALMKCFTLASLAQVHAAEEVKFVGKNEYECMILSKSYKNQYLYAGSLFNKFNSSYRDVSVWAPIFTSGPKEFTDDDKQGVWILKRVTNRPSAYYLQNKQFGEYIFAVVILSRRKIFTCVSTTDPVLDEKYMWYFKKLDDSLFEITNVEFKECNEEFLFLKIYRKILYYSIWY